ncbi:MAG: GNAT family N-acetyltransferase [Paracoccaceae bacterium]
MFWRRSRIRLSTRRLDLRPPKMADYPAWSRLRQEGEEFLREWEPVWSEDHLTRRAFRNRVYWARRSIEAGKALPLFMFLRETGHLVGAITLDNIRRGPAQTGTVGYWIGRDYSRQGYMTEALKAVTDHAFNRLDLSRIEAACLPENTASRALLERTGFKYEGVAQSYLQIAGRWRTHVLYAQLRSDRRGRTEAG